MRTQFTRWIRTSYVACDSLSSSQKRVSISQWTWLMPIVLNQLFRDTACRSGKTNVRILRISATAQVFLKSVRAIIDVRLRIARLRDHATRSLFLVNYCLWEFTEIMGQGERVARMGTREMSETSWFISLLGREHSEDLSVDGGIILKWMRWKQGGRVWTGLI